MSLKDDPDQQMITLLMPREDASLLLRRANAMGWSRAELIRRLVSLFLSVHPNQVDTGRQA